MPSNKRIFYAVESIAFAKPGTSTYTGGHGLQSAGINTKFTLDPTFELSQIELYSLVEDIPSIEVTLEKCIDGYPLIYHLATNGATSSSLSGRSNIKTTVGMSLYSDSQDSASGTPIAQVVMSGMFVSALNYNFQVQGNSSESVTLVGNTKVAYSSGVFTAPTFNNLDTPLAAEGINRRQNVLFGSAGCKLPQDIPGISSSGTNELSGADFGAHVQSIKVSTNLGRNELFELGRRGPYHRFVSFPVEVKCDIEVLSISSDGVTALEDATNNLTDRTILIKSQDSTTIDLGTKNKLASVSYGGANAGQNGGNATATYSFSNYNRMTVTHSQDPSGL